MGTANSGMGMTTTVNGDVVYGAFYGSHLYTTTTDSGFTEGYDGTDGYDGDTKYRDEWQIQTTDGGITVNMTSAHNASNTAYALSGVALTATQPLHLLVSTGVGF